VSELGKAGDDVADGVEAGYGGLHPLVDADKAAVESEADGVEAGVVGAGAAADGDENLFGFLGLLLASGVGVDDFGAGGGLFDLLDLAGDVDVDAALFVLAGEFFGDLFVFDVHDAGKGFDDGDLCAEAVEDGGELDTDCA
jgi:hypothetical protein